MVRNKQWLKQAKGLVSRGIGIVIGLIVVYILIDVLVKVWLIVAAID
jgi:hypothetical protein